MRVDYNALLRAKIQERVDELIGRRDHPDCTSTARALIEVRLDELTVLMNRWGLES